VRSPELNLIEVRWLWLQRQTAINNYTFKDEHEIGRTVSKWKNIYNKNHDKAITDILQEDVPLCIQSCYLTPMPFFKDGFKGGTHLDAIVF
jgi:hypothetical protein